MTIKNNSGTPIDIKTIKSGTLRAFQSFDDYDIVSGRDYKVHFSDDTGAYILPKDTIRLWNNELRQDVCDKLIWIENN